MKTIFLNPLPVEYALQFATMMSKERITLHQDDRPLIGLIDKENNKLISMMGWKRNKLDPRKIAVLSVWTNPAYRRKGYFSQLFDEFERIMLTMDCDVFYATCTQYSISEFIKRGFKPTGKKVGNMTYVEFSYNYKL